MAGLEAADIDVPMQGQSPLPPPVLSAEAKISILTVQRNLNKAIARARIAQLEEQAALQKFIEVRNSVVARYINAGGYNPDNYTFDDEVLVFELKVKGGV